MKINQYGTVTLTRGEVQVSGWLVERESTDPADATAEELLLETAITWAQGKMNDAIMGNLRRISKMRKDAAEHLTQN